MSISQDSRLTFFNMLHQIKSVAAFLPVALRLRRNGKRLYWNDAGLFERKDPDRAKPRGRSTFPNDERTKEATGFPRFRR